MRTAGALCLFTAALSWSCGKVTVDVDAGEDIDAAEVIDAEADPPPTAATLSPDWGTMEGGTTVTITGTNFIGTVTVSFGGAEATSVTVVSATELTAVTPAGPHSPVDVTVTTATGADDTDSQFRYLAPLYAAQGMGHRPGNLYTVVPATGASTLVGAFAFNVTGLALSRQGLLLAMRPTNINDVVPVPAELYLVNPYTAQVTLIGNAVDATDVNVLYHSVSCITFENDRLLGWVESKTGAGGRDALAEIDPTSGQVTDLGAASTASGGSCVIGRGTGTLVGVLNRANLNTIDPVSGATTAGIPLVPPMGDMPGLAFVGTTLYAANKQGGGPKVTAWPGGTLPQQTQLVTIDTTTGFVVVVGPLPDDIDALVGIATLATAAEPPPVARAAPALARAPEAVTLRVSHGGSASIRAIPARGRPGSRVSLAALAAQAPGARAVELVTGTDSVTIPLAEAGARGLQLTANQRGQIKLVDAQGRKLGAGIVEVRILD